MFDEQHLAGASARIGSRQRGAQQHAVVACGVDQWARQASHLAGAQLRKFRTDAFISRADVRIGAVRDHILGQVRFVRARRGILSYFK
jgi:hypothetical protein